MTLIDARNRMEHYRGRISEQLAANYYLAQRVQVYWPSVQQGAVDFVVGKPDGLRRVQVKTATWNHVGKQSYLQCRVKLTNKHTAIPLFELYDLLVVIWDDNVWEIPAGLINTTNLTLANSRRGFEGHCFTAHRVVLGNLMRLQ